MCKCCEEIEFWKNEKIDKTRFKQKIYAKISIYTWRKEQRATKGKQISTITTEPFSLKYCPTCGKELE